MLKQDSRVRVDIWPRVFGLPLLQQDVWCYLVQVRNQFEHLVVWQMLQSEFTLASVTRVRFSKDCVPVARNNLATLQMVPHPFAQFCFRDIGSKLRDNFVEENEHFLNNDFGQPI